jgi:hypothetical protein
MRVRVLVSELKYGLRFYKMGQELLVRDDEAVLLIKGDAVEPVGRLAQTLLAAQQVIAGELAEAEAKRQAELHHDRQQADLRLRGSTSPEGGRIAELLTMRAQLR